MTVKEWKKQVNQDGKFYDAIGATILILGLIGFVIHEPLLYVPTVLLIVYAAASIFYDRYSGSSFKLQNPKKSIRLFPGDSYQWIIRLDNYSLTPVLNGIFSFQTGKSVISKGDFVNEYTDFYKYKLPITLSSRGLSAVKVPVTAEHRGVTKATNITFRYPHLVNFNPIKMIYQKAYQTEFIVYPKPEPIIGLKELSHMSRGEQAATFSPYEDPLSPLGTRDYVSSDPFHKIHWKASAKTQSLKTKVLEREVDSSWTIVVNVTDQTRLGNEHLSSHLEKILSCASYLCYHATENGNPYEMLINMRKPHKNPFFHQLEGEGNQHLRQSLEMLARIDKEQMTLPIDHMLHRLNRDTKKIIILLGHRTDRTETFIKEWLAKGVQVFHVDMEGSEPFIRPIGEVGNND